MANKLPRWRGFNLLDMYIYEPGREAIRAGDTAGPGGYGGGEGDFLETDFAWIHGWGFDFVRIPLDYRYWTESLGDGSWRAREGVLARIDRLVSLGEKYGVHVSLSFHRAPGYCVNPPPEAEILWSNRRMQAMFYAQWRMFAERYRGVPAERLSFDLVNEPPAVGVMGFLGGSGMTRKAHERVMRGAVAAIRAVDPERLILINGLNYGSEPVEELADVPGLGQSCRMYAPFGITHYQAPWVKYLWWKEPAWPGADHFGKVWGREELAGYFAKWGRLVDAGVGVHCGEGGAFRNTPHEVVLRWMEDSLGMLKVYEIGWALWNFRGDFGVLDSGRRDVAYADFQGHSLDVRMLELLQRH